MSRLLGIIVLCECREYLERSEATLHDELTTEFVRKFKAPTWGRWIEFTRKGLKLLARNHVELTMPELSNYFFKGGSPEDASDTPLFKLLKLRNDMAHERTKPVHHTEFEYLCSLAYPLLKEMMEGASFMLDYQFTSVSKVVVEKKRKTAPAFTHHMNHHIGNSISIPSGRETLNSILDIGSVILINNKTGKFLNLDPLLVYEKHDQKLEDVFFYGGMSSPDKAEYVACHHGKNFVSSEAGRSDELIEELNLMLDLFGPQDSAPEVVNG
ncbi:MAG: hypothetical protein LLG06_02055 [Desulfobacteraceae bacterium]|nr:hypothetical protein [Desulfobacteraceae bacterium]